MTRLWVLSDLHLEHLDVLPSYGYDDIPDADICVVAGDVYNRGLVPSLSYLAEQIAPWMPVVFVPGNHEFYRASFMESMYEARKMRLPGVHMLDDSAVVLLGVRFVGGTLWTDMELGGGREFNCHAAESMMNDYRAIKYSKQPYKRLFARDLVAIHHETRRAIDGYLRVPHNGPTVVITHHAPHPNSVPDRFSGSALNAAYASDLTDLIERGRPNLWVHGHMHDASDYMVGQTRVVSNPRGYPDENLDFDPQMVIEV